MADEKRNYLRPELGGALGLGLPTWAMPLQMFDPQGLSPSQLDRNAAMRSPLLLYAARSNPNIGRFDTATKQGADSQLEDMNSVFLKYLNWRKRNAGFELSPQERITQGFLDVRNPNSWF